MIQVGSIVSGNRAKLKSPLRGTLQVSRQGSEPEEMKMETQFRLTESAWIKTSGSLMPDSSLSAYFKHSTIWGRVSGWNTVPIAQGSVITGKCQVHLGTEFCFILQPDWPFQSSHPDTLETCFTRNPSLSVVRGGEPYSIFQR